MLSKEEIEKAKKRIKILMQDDCDCEECIKYKEAYKTILEYTKQLEKREQKLIEKLEKDSSDGFIEEHKDNHKIVLKQKVKPVRQYIKQELFPFVKEVNKN